MIFISNAQLSIWMGKVDGWVDTVLGFVGQIKEKVLKYFHIGLNPMQSRLDRKRSNRQFSCPNIQDSCSIVLLHPTSKNISPNVSLLYYYPQTPSFPQEWEPQHCLSTLVWLFDYRSFPFLKAGIWNLFFKSLLLLYLLPTLSTPSCHLIHRKEHKPLTGERGNPKNLSTFCTPIYQVICSFSLLKRKKYYFSTYSILLWTLTTSASFSEILPILASFNLQFLPLAFKYLLTS